MKKFYKNWMYLAALIGIAILILVGQLMMFVSERPSVGHYFGEYFSGAGIVGVSFLLIIGFANFLGSHFTLPRKYDYITQSLPMLLILAGGVICGAAIMGALYLGSQSEWILVELYTSIGLIIALCFAGSFLRGMSDDDHIEAEITAPYRKG